jgi:hypothetical protein
MQKFRVIVTDGNRQELAERVKDALLSAPVGYVAQISQPSRSLDQNAYMWPFLTALSAQLEWPVLVNGNWQKAKLSPDDWKDFLTGSFEGDARRMAMGMDGTGLIMLGRHTSGYSKAKFSEFIEFMNEFGARNDVKFQDREQP